MYTDTVKRGVTSVVLCISFLVISLALFLSAVNPAIAFGISAPYFADDTMRVEPGMDYEYSLSMQNGDDTGYNVIVDYSSTENVATLDRTEYIVPSKTYDTSFSFKIAIPSSAKVGDTYYLEYSAKPFIVESSINDTGNNDTGNDTGRIDNINNLTINDITDITGSGSDAHAVAGSQVMEIRRSIKILVVGASSPVDSQADAGAASDSASGSDASGTSDNPDSAAGLGLSHNGKRGGNRGVSSESESALGSGLTSRFWGVGKYLLFALLLAAAVFIIIRMWKVSSSISSKLSDPCKPIRPISQADSLREVADLLETIGDDEFEVPEIKELFKGKISELTDGKLALDLVYLTRKDTISIVERLR